MSPEAWAFFTANSVALITLLGQAWSTRRKLNSTSIDAEIARVNTTSISNGAISRMGRDLTAVKTLVISMEQRLRHVEEQLK